MSEPWEVNTHGDILIIDPNHTQDLPGKEF